MAGDNAAGDVCPVDHKTRDLWLAQAREQAKAQEAAAAAQCPVPHAQRQQQQQQQQQQQSPPQPSSSWFRLPFWSSSSSSPSPSPSFSAPPHGPPSAGLGTHRVVSSIPRSTSDPLDAMEAAAAAAAVSTPASCPVNHEVESGADAASGNWVYPSEKMFFDAMKRKGNEGARAADMKVVVPIHNAVNERAWKEILAWEAPYTAGAGGGAGGASSAPCVPRLYSFAGLSTKMTPKARLNTLLGYSAPFDRHDWIVDRCGTRIEYVIDFYAGRPTSTPAKSGAGAPPPLSFYLDVRPKLNSWEGVKMRALRALGLA